MKANIEKHRHSRNCDGVFSSHIAKKEAPKSEYRLRGFVGFVL
ncbi:hypothetical protein HMPREF3201_01601 [Megasphaera sp. MJR8396C]|nr:hypothetical protein HMPREF3201_01601 [Megasphaera sp. MJR8396C]